LTKEIWEISASVGFIKKKFVTMHGHMYSGELLMMGRGTARNM
jgi:hypothetical protein